MRYLVRRLAVTGTMLVCLGVALRAQEAQTIRAGEMRVLASSSSEIKSSATQTAHGAKVVLGQTSETPKLNMLLYTAPATAVVFTETVAYTIDSTAHTVAVTVTPADDTPYADTFNALFELFVLALLLESALALLFNWHPFVVYFDGRGVKTLISFAVALMFTKLFDMDIVARLLSIYSHKESPHSTLGMFVTAMIAAGGSAAVNSVLVGLGFRSVKTAEQVAPKPPKTEGWISVSVTRDKSEGPVDVLIGTPTAGPPPGPPPEAGTITGTKRLGNFLRLFVRDSSRFPTSGGFAVPANSTCKVLIKGVDANGAALTPKEWGPETIAPGAIIDLDFKF